MQSNHCISIQDYMWRSSELVIYIYNISCPHEVIQNYYIYLLYIIVILFVKTVFDLHSFSSRISGRIQDIKPDTVYQKSLDIRYSPIIDLFWVSEWYTIINNLYWFQSLTHLFITSEAFYMDVVIDASGKVMKVNIHHQVSKG